MQALSPAAQQAIELAEKAEALARSLRGEREPSVIEGEYTTVSEPQALEPSHEV